MSINTAELESYWMPFTANQDFKKNPRIMVGVNVPLPVPVAYHSFL